MQTVRAWQYLQALCALPPRGSASEGERRAAEWLHQRLAEMGYRVEQQAFRSPRHTLYLGPLEVIVVLLGARMAVGPLGRSCGAAELAGARSPRRRACGCDRSGI